MRSLICLFLMMVSFLCADEFDLLMGKNTHHWNHLKNPEDEKMLNHFKELYESQKSLDHAHTEAVRIPKVIHFIWLGPRQYPPGSVENIRTWMAHNPDWRVKFWTDREREAPCKGMETILIKEYPFPFLKRCYETSENWGEKSDVLRYEILYQEGGVYADHDANCIQSFDGLHQAYDLYCGLEMPHLPMGGYTVTLGNGVIGSKPGHPVIKKVIETISSRWDEFEKKYEERDPFSRAEIVIERTYLALTRVMKETAGKGSTQDIILPAAYFFAKAGVRPLYSKHFFANSWASRFNENAAFEKSTKGSLQKIEQKVDNSLMFVLGFSVLNLIFIGFFQFKRNV